MNSEERPPTVVSLAVDASNAQPEEAFDQLNVETNNHLSLTSNGHWFEKHSRLDFTRYMTIEAKICWSYWTVSKYSHLVEQGRTKEAESFIENNRAQILKNLHSAGTDIEEWNEAPSDMRTLLKASYQSSKLFVFESIDASDSINFHHKLGLKKEEPIEELMVAIDREQQLMRLSAQHLDESDLNALYCKWAYVYYELIKRLNSVSDANSWRAFRIACWKSLRGTLPEQGLIESTAAATIGHLEVESNSKNTLINRFTDLWLHLFTSSAQFNRALIILIKHRNFPSDPVLRQFEQAIDIAARKQFDSNIMLANLFLNHLKRDAFIDQRQMSGQL